MTTKSVEFKVQISDFDAAAWKRLQEARDAVRKIESEIKAAYEKSDRLKAVRDLAGYGDYGTKFMTNTLIDGGQIATRTVIDLPEEETVARVQSLNIGEKTINALLSGKLLDDDQKKALLKRIGVDLDTLTEKAGA